MKNLHKNQLKNLHKNQLKNQLKNLPKNKIKKILIFVMLCLKIPIAIAIKMLWKINVINQIVSLNRWHKIVQKHVVNLVITNVVLFQLIKKAVRLSLIRDTALTPNRLNSWIWIVLEAAVLKILNEFYNILEINPNNN